MEAVAKFEPLRDALAGVMKRAGTELARYRRYRRTHAELQDLPLDVLLDLDLYRGDLKQVARRAVYSN